MANGRRKGRADLPAALKEASAALQQGRVREALRLLEAHLAAAPDDVAALNLAGVALLTAGQPANAVPVLERAAALDPRNLDASTHLGIAYVADGRTEEGMASLEKAVSLRRDHVPAQFNLGLAYLKAGRAADAIGPLKAAAKGDPRNPGARLNLGVAQAQAGDATNALASLENAVRLAPKDADARRNLATLLVETGAPARAIPILEKLLTENADDQNARFALAAACERTGQRARAIELYGIILATDETRADCHTNLAPDLERFGRLADAERHYRRAVELDPLSPKPLLNLAGFLARVGRHDEVAPLCEGGATVWPEEPGFLERLAGHRYRRLADGAGGRAAAHELLERFPDNITALEYLVLDPEAGLDAETVSNLARTIGAQEGAVEDRGRLCFVLFEHFHRGGEYERAFAWLKRGNDLIRSTFEHTANRDTVLTSRIAEIFSQGFFAARKGWGEASERPVFIVGMPRSGTTLVEQILSRHSAVAALGELDDVSEIGGDLALAAHAERGYPRAFSDVTQEAVAEAAGRYVARTAALAGDAARVTDKMPGNFRYLGVIALMLPNARVVHCRRDAMDVCFSIYRHNFRSRHPYAADLRELANYHKQYERLMAHWQKACPLPIHEIVYEDLVDDLEGSVRRLLDFCGLPYEEACLSFHESDRSVETASWSQVRAPLFRSSIGAWRRYEAGLEPLVRALYG